MKEHVSHTILYVQSFKVIFKPATATAHYCFTKAKAEPQKTKWLFSVGIKSNQQSNFQEHVSFCTQWIPFIISSEGVLKYKSCFRDKFRVYIQIDSFDTKQ